MQGGDVNKRNKLGDTLLHEVIVVRGYFACISSGRVVSVREVLECSVGPTF